MTYGFCVYHGIECDFKGSCLDCPHNTDEDAKWFRQDEEQAEIEIHRNFTDSEIAKAFIEVVEAVKELLPRTESEGKT